MSTPIHSSLWLLLVEDHADLAQNIGEFLQQAGYVVDFAADGLSGLHLASTQRYDAIILDVSLPGLDGVSLCQRLRNEGRNTVPVLMLTARDTERDTLLGFAAGADDYLTKPFSLRELQARLLALTRRAKGFSSQLQVADLCLDLSTFEVRRGTAHLQVTASGFKLLEALMRASPKVLTKLEVERVLWGDTPPDSDAALRGHIHALRTAIDGRAAQKLLHTVHGVGYRIAVTHATE